MRQYNSLQLREIFHLELLRWLGRKIKARDYVLKGGTNLRFFFNSRRYSEDMDLDVRGVEKHVLCDVVMKILEAPSFQDNLRTFGIERIVLPDLAKAKQIQTTQRFKVHLITQAGEDLFTKVEFSKRGFKGEAIVQPVLDVVLRIYKLPPVIVPHYDIRSAAAQKIQALSERPVIQARDIFDLYILSSQYEQTSSKVVAVSDARAAKAHENVFAVSFEQFRDTVISYLAVEDQDVYNDEAMWDEVKLKTTHFIEEICKKNV